MKKIFLAMCIMCPLFMFGQNVAYVYVDSIFLTVPEYKANVQKLDTMRQNLKKELDLSQSEIQQKYDKLIKPYNVKETETLNELKKRMSAVDTLNLSLIMSDNQQLQTKRQTYDRILQTNYAKDVQPLIDKVSNTIAEYSREFKLSMVFVVEQMRPALAYIDPKQNITAIIIRRLHAKPVAKSK